MSLMKASWLYFEDVCGDDGADNMIGYFHR